MEIGDEILLLACLFGLPGMNITVVNNWVVNIHVINIQVVNIQVMSIQEMTSMCYVSRWQIFAGGEKTGNNYFMRKRHCYYKIE